MLLFLVALWALAPQTLSQTCFWPDGDLALDNFPCNPSADASFCCQVGSICSTNQLCIDEYGTYRRGSCTDASWDSASCPKFCTTEVNGTHSDAGSYEDLLYCGTGDTSTNFVACCGDPGNYYTCDCATTPHITLGPLKEYTTISTSATAAGSSGTSVASSSAATTQSLVASQSSTHSSSAVPTATPLQSHTLSTGAIAGVAIGVVVAVAIIAILGFLLWRTRRHLTQNPTRMESSRSTTQLASSAGASDETKISPTSPRPYTSEMSSEAGTWKNNSRPHTGRHNNNGPTSGGANTYELSSGQNTAHEAGTLDRLRG